MINKEEFSSLVKSSITYTSKGFPYLIIGDEAMFCPFCGQELFMEEELRCTCESSIKFSEKYCNLKYQMETAQLGLVELKDTIDPIALQFFKQYFSKQIFPALQEEFNRNFEEILELKELI